MDARHKEPCIEASRVNPSARAEGVPLLSGRVASDLAHTE